MKPRWHSPTQGRSAAEKIEGASLGTILMAPSGEARPGTNAAICGRIAIACFAIHGGTAGKSAAASAMPPVLPAAILTGKADVFSQRNDRPRGPARQPRLAVPAYSDARGKDKARPFGDRKNAANRYPSVLAGFEKLQHPIHAAGRREIGPSTEISDEHR